MELEFIQGLKFKDSKKRKFQFRVGGGNMIKYLMDISVPEDCKCAKCCIYCE